MSWFDTRRLCRRCRAHDGHKADQSNSHRHLSHCRDWICREVFSWWTLEQSQCISLFKLFCGLGHRDLKLITWQSKTCEADCTVNTTSCLIVACICGRGRRHVDIVRWKGWHITTEDKLGSILITLKWLCRPIDNKHRKRFLQWENQWNDFLVWCGYLGHFELCI